MDRFILKEVTEGKYLNRSLLYHIEYQHLNFIYESPEMRSKTAGFRSFVQYLLKNYLLENSKFPFEQWNYHDSIQNGDMGVTTNPLENINLKLKSKMGHGYLPKNQLSES